jgi:Flp pilus assembly protein TadD
LHGADHPLVGGGLSALGAILTQRGSYEEAERVLLEAVGKLEAGLPSGHRDTRAAHRNLAALYAALGRRADAERYRLLSEQ